MIVSKVFYYYNGTRDPALLDSTVNMQHASRAYDKILRWPDNMSGHYIFSTDIFKNTRTIIVINIFIVIIINMQVYMYTVYILYINIICVTTRNRNEFI